MYYPHHRFHLEQSDRKRQKIIEKQPNLYERDSAPLFLREAPGHRSVLELGSLQLPSGQDPAGRGCVIAKQRVPRVQASH